MNDSMSPNSSKSKNTEDTPATATGKYAGWEVKRVALPFAQLVGLKCRKFADEITAGQTDYIIIPFCELQRHVSPT